MQSMNSTALRPSTNSGSTLSSIPFLSSLTRKERARQPAETGRDQPHPPPLPTDPAWRSDCVPRVGVSFPCLSKKLYSTVHVGGDKTLWTSETGEEKKRGARAHAGARAPGSAGTQAPAPPQGQRRRTGRASSPSALTQTPVSFRVRQEAREEPRNLERKLQSG